MSTKDPEAVTKNDVQQVSKKLYRKPSVQVYGTLFQLTQNTPNPAAFRVDPGAPPAPNQRT